MGKQIPDFHAASPGIVYQVQTSTDLQSWTTDGVAVSELGEDGLEVPSQGRHEGALGADAGPQAGLGQEVQGGLRKAALVGECDAKHGFCLPC